MAISARQRGWLNNLDIACLTIALGVGLLWVRSCWISDSFTWPWATGDSQLQIHRGGIHILFLEYARGGLLSNKFWIADKVEVSDVWAEANVARWGQQLVLGCGFAPGNGYTAVRVPMWLTIVVFILYPIWWHQHPHRRPRNRFEICRGCGYDLRGSEARCPECGRPFVRAPIVHPPPAPPRVRLQPSLTHHKS